MLKIVTIIGARPQFIKAAVISRLIRESYKDRISEFLVHTGQHYDENMSDIFFREMMIPTPDLNLEIGSGSHGAMTGKMLEKIEAVLLDRKPDFVLVYGDTNSTIAGALAASKLNIPVAHVEAGLRSFNKVMPEEQNRILADHISSFLFCPTDTAVSNLHGEGIIEGVYKTGDIMLDASLFYRSLNFNLSFKVPDDYYLVTIHRAENTDDPERLAAIIEALNLFDNLPGIFPMHPRTKKMIEKYGFSFNSNIKIINPVGYLDMIALESRCRFIVTDSGGVQKEAYFFKKPCITLRDQTEWVETVTAGANVVVGADKDKINEALIKPPFPAIWPDLYGDGRSGQYIVETLLNQ